jgi:hypothetical protein
MSGQALPLGALLMLLYSLGIAGTVYRFGRRDGAQAAADALAVGAAAGPSIVGLVTIGALALLGGGPDRAYVYFHLGVAAALAIAAAKPAYRALKELWLFLQAKLRLVVGFEMLLVVVLALQIAWIFYLTLVTPLIGNDPLEYATVAKILYGRRALDTYPLVAPDPQTGVYAPWTHPPLYVALIFLAYVLQGTAELPGLMRVIPLYCMLATLVLMSRLALRAKPGRRGVRMALLACIVFLATPLLRDMVGTASIDALPILGLTLTFAVACLYAQSPLAVRGWLAGIALGLSLWAHSSAILFPALAAVAVGAVRWAQRRPFALECGAVLAVGTLLGCPAYLRNVAIFGSPISDTPPVLTLGHLDWEAYFEAGREMAGLYDKMLLGVLRGWTDGQHYWLSFWLMTAGLALFVRDLQRAGLDRDGGRPILFGAAALVLAYHGGMLLSVIVGTTLMIKNARYLLSVLPFAALFAALALSRILELGPSQLEMQLRRAGRKFTFSIDFGRVHPAKSASWALLWLGLIAFVVLVLHQVSVNTDQWRYYLGSLSGAMRLSQEEQLSKFAFYRVQKYMDANLGRQAKVLSLRPADLYYARYLQVSYLDPALLPAYNERDAAGMAAALAALGITHIYAPNYSLPVVQNSALVKVMTDERFSRMTHADSYYAVFELKHPKDGAPSQRPVRTWDLSPWRYDWTVVTQAHLPIFPQICRSAASPLALGIPKPFAACELLPKHRGTYITGDAPPDDYSLRPTVELVPADRYRYEATLSGEGFFRVIVYEFHWPTVQIHQFDDGLLDTTPKSYGRVFKLPTNLRHARFAFWTEGRGKMTIHAFRLDALQDKPVASPHAAANPLSDGPTGRTPAR